MRILYGIQSNGNGHITRSSKIIHKLIKNGCEVDILLSGNNSQVNLSFPVKYKFTGFNFHYSESGEVNYFKTIWNINILKFIKDIRLDVSSYDIVISDFEPITAWACKISGKDCIGISNQCSFLSDNTPRPKNKKYLSEFVLRNMAPVSKPIGLHFEKYDNFIFTPIIKEIFIKLPINDYGYYTVYLPTYKIENIVNKLVKTKGKFEIFGNVTKSIKYKNCTIKKIQRDSFEQSLINCHGVITAAGFQTTSESLFLGKKLMIIPIIGQYEQECNEVSLKKLGVFTGTTNDIDKFINCDNIIKMNWKDSSDDIVNIILSH